MRKVAWRARARTVLGAVLDGVRACVMLSPNNQLYLSTKNNLLCLVLMPFRWARHRSRCRREPACVLLPRLAELEGRMTVFTLQSCSVFSLQLLKCVCFCRRNQVVFTALPPSGDGHLPRTKQVVSKLGSFDGTKYSKSSIAWYCKECPALHWDQL